MKCCAERGTHYCDITGETDWVRKMIDKSGRDIRLEVDGGVDAVTAPQCVAAGADVLVAGSAVFKGGSVANPAPYGENIRAIRKAAEAAL